MTSAFYRVKGEKKLNELLRKKTSKSSSALLSCMIKVFMGFSNVEFVIDSTLRVLSMTNFHHWNQGCGAGVRVAWSRGNEPGVGVGVGVGADETA